MHLDDQPVCTRGHRGSPHGGDLRSDSRAVARVRDDREMRKRLDDGDGRKIQHVSGMRVEAAYTTLAQDHVGVSLGENILGREQKLLDRSGHATFEQHGRLPVRPARRSSG